jgi:hypothetical protein
MVNDGSRLARRVDRRRLLRGATGAIAGAAAAALGAPASAEPAVVLDVCFWRKQSSYCKGGQLQEYWCYICCAGLDCETITCEWRSGGSC